MGGILLTAQDGAIYLGKEQFITLAVVLSVFGSVLVFLLKHYFSQIVSGISANVQKIEQVKTDLGEDIRKNYDKTNERIDHLEEKTNGEMAELRQDLNEIKGEFATTFVQREDFFRYMNGMEANIKDTNAKVDKILMIRTDRRDRNSE